MISVLSDSQMQKAKAIHSKSSFFVINVASFNFGSTLSNVDEQDAKILIEKIALGLSLKAQNKPVITIRSFVWFWILPYILPYILPNQYCVFFFDEHDKNLV